MNEAKIGPVFAGGDINGIGREVVKACDFRMQLQCIRYVFKFPLELGEENGRFHDVPQMPADSVGFLIDRHVIIAESQPEGAGQTAGPGADHGDPLRLFGYMVAVWLFVRA